MYVRDVGRGPAVLLLHGTPSPADDWMSISDALSDRFRVLVPDLPGYGNSPRLASSSMESVGDAIAEMLHDRGVETLHAIGGYSTGVYRAFDLALRKQFAPHVMVALAGIVNLEEPDRALRIQLGDALAADASFLDSETLKDVMRQLMLSDKWRSEHPGDVQRVIGWLRATTAPALAAECHALAAMRDLRPEIRGFQPVVYARVGELDIGAPPMLSREIIDLVAHGTLQIVPGVGHGLMIEDGAATTAAVVHAISNA